jgi:formylglycine-generating enzyme required for sulfatase activity
MGEDQEQNMYNSPENSENLDFSSTSTSLISNDTRVYKGGSWLDRSYYLDPAQRRFLPEYMTTNFIGFRCAMSYLGESRNVSKPKKR